MYQECWWWIYHRNVLIRKRCFSKWWALVQTRAMFKLILYRLCHLNGHFLLVILEAETKARGRQMRISFYLGTNDSGGEILVPFLLSHVWLVKYSLWQEWFPVSFKNPIACTQIRGPVGLGSTRCRGHIVSVWAPHLSGLQAGQQIFHLAHALHCRHFGVQTAAQTLSLCIWFNGPPNTWGY